MKRLLLTWILLGSVHFLFAQNVIKIRGVVTSAGGVPLPGITILEKDGNHKTITKTNGTYEILAPEDATLVFNAVGYIPLEEKVNHRTLIKVVLKEKISVLDQVVVVGYGTQKRKDLTGAISSVSGKELEKVPVQNIGQAVQGRLAGVQVTMSDGTPGSKPTIKIRGGTSITQSNEPLYVVDGVPQTDGLDFLDPTDIESVDVLKDASAAAIYGARGANGVILVTTKKNRAGKTTLSYDGYVAVKKLAKELPMMQPKDYLLLQYERALGDSAKTAVFTSRYGAFDSLDYYYNTDPGIDWQDEVFGSPVLSQYHKISISGGDKQTQFNVFYSRGDDKGIMTTSRSVKNIGKLALTHKVGKKLTLNATVNYSNQEIQGLGTNEGGNARLSFLQNVLRYRPVSGRNASDDDLLDLDIDPYDPSPEAPTFQSPLITLRTSQRDQVQKKLNMYVQLQYTILNHLTYRGLVSYNEGNYKTKRFTQAGSVTAIRSGGPFGDITEVSSHRLSYNNTITYANTFKRDHKLDITVGQEYLSDYAENFSASASGFPEENLGWNDLSLGTIAGMPNSYAEDSKLLSFFGRLNYGYKDKYLLTASLRADGSSKFGTDQLWGYFPSLAAAWRIIQEPFMQSLSAVSDLKLRVSYGETGNNRIANYAALGIFNSGVYPLNNQVVATAYQNNLPNPSLKWEANKSLNIGLDMGFFDQRITLTTELYDNRSKDLLFNTRVPASSGYTTQFQNIGTTSSKGLEFTLNTINIKQKAFSWSTSFNIAFPKTKVLSLGPDQQSMVTNSYSTTNDYILAVGKPVGLMYGYISDGLYRVDDFNYDMASGLYTLKEGVASDNITVQPGYIKFKDLNKDGLINDQDRTVIGDANPDYTGGLNNSFNYKGFDLSIFLNFTVGNDIYNANVLNNMKNNEYYNSFAFLSDRWTTMNAKGEQITGDPEQLAALNKGKRYPSFLGNGTARLYNDMIEDGSFLRINNISFGYSLPKSWIQKAKITKARIYVTAYNLHVFTRYSGYDPEVSVINNAITPGVDFSAYPRARSIVFGLNLSF